MLDDHYSITKNDIRYLQSGKTMFHINGKIDVSKLKPWLDQNELTSWLFLYLLALDPKDVAHQTLAKEAWPKFLRWKMDYTLNSMINNDREFTIKAINHTLKTPSNQEIAPALWLKIALASPFLLDSIDSSTVLSDITPDALNRLFEVNPIRDNRNQYLELAAWLHTKSVHGKTLEEAILKHCLLDDLGNKDTDLRSMINHVWKPLSSSHDFLPFLTEGLKKTKSKNWLDKLNIWSKETLSRSHYEPYEHKAALAIQQYMALSLESKIKSKTKWTKKNFYEAQQIATLPATHPLREQILEKLRDCLSDTLPNAPHDFTPAIRVLFETPPDFALSILNSCNINKTTVLQNILNQQNLDLIEKPMFQHLFPRSEFLELQLGLLIQDDGNQETLQMLGEGLITQQTPNDHSSNGGLIIKEIHTTIKYDMHVHQNDTRAFYERISEYAKTELHALLGLDLSYMCTVEPDDLVSTYGFNAALACIHALDPAWLENNPEMFLELTSPDLTNSRAVKIYNQLLDHWFGKDSRNEQVMALFDSSNGGTMLLEHFKQCYRRQHDLDKESAPSIDLSALF